MSSKVNIKARIKRHSEILKEDLTNTSPMLALYRKVSYRFVIGVFVIILPIYPLFSNVIYATSKIDFYRGNIDTSSILEAYDEQENTDGYSSTDNGFVIVNAPLEDERDTEGVNEIIEYKVSEGDSYDSIAKKFEISTNSILWANNFAFSRELKTGETIKIPSVSGLVHNVEKRETLDMISGKYGVSKEKIIAQNNIEENNFGEGMTLIIPGAKKYSNIRNNTASASNGYSFAKSIGKSGQSKEVEDTGLYKLVKRKTGYERFYWGNCTRFVAMYKEVTWGGNAKEWLKNAQALNVPTGKNPGVGAIVVLHGRGYNPRYGHVAIVVDVTKESIIVKDMNYRRINEVTVREIPKDDAAIKGYIYAK
ncbi:MAG: LysM peptidoglycan-binding domain-containing protein [Candidatus Gracilibacteria bacterium]|nr:LysM peptidoglycan-binding domain-containing protein [Candidatus Gracilibacteria bacterium]